MEKLFEPWRRRIVDLVALKQDGVEVEFKYVSNDGEDMLTRDSIKRVHVAMRGVAGLEVPQAGGVDSIDVSVTPNRVTYVGDGPGMGEVTEVLSKTPVSAPLDTGCRMRVNVKRETPLTGRERAAAIEQADATTNTRHARMKRRFSLAYTVVAAESGSGSGSGRGPLRVRVDITAVREAQRKFGERSATRSELASAPETYEIEVELLDNAGHTAEQCADALLAKFYRILQALDGTVHVARPDALRAVVAEYKALVVPAQPNGHRERTEDFIGPQPVPLDRARLPMLLEGYTVTHKADGERRLLLVAADGCVYTLNNRLVARATGLRCRTLRSCLLDGEHVCSEGAKQAVPPGVRSEGAKQAVPPGVRSEGAKQAVPPGVRSEGAKQAVPPGVRSEGAKQAVPPCDQHQRFLVFDAYFVDGKDVRPLPLMHRGRTDDEAVDRHVGRNRGRGKSGGGNNHADRLAVAHAVVADIDMADAATSMAVSVKEFRLMEPALLRAEAPASQQQQQRQQRQPPPKFFGVTDACRAMFASQDKQPFEVDGLIFTPQSTPVPVKGGTWYSVFKWKPPEHNSIDFEVQFMAEPPFPVTLDGSLVMCQAAQLMVGVNPLLVHPITAMDYLTGQAARRQARFSDPRQSKYIATPFAPAARPAGGDAAPDPSVCYLRLRTGAGGAASPVCASGDVITDGMIVEFSYDTNPKLGLEALHPARWTPMRVRWDKIERQIRSKADSTGANNAKTAQGVWDGIQQPISDETLSSATLLQALVREVRDGPQADYYFSAAHTGRGNDLALSAFHNTHVKRGALLERFTVRSIIDFGCGRGGDLAKWEKTGAVRVLGIDKFASNLYSPGNDSAYGRLLDAKRTRQQQQQQQQQQQPQPQIVFLPMDASQPISSLRYIESLPGDGGGAPSDRDVAKVLWGHVPRERARSLQLDHVYALAKSPFDLAACMFAVHYFFDRRESLETFARNVGEALSPGGHFVGCCLDAALVLDLLAAEAPDEGDAVQDGGPGNATPKWRITNRMPPAVMAAALAERAQPATQATLKRERSELEMQRGRRAPASAGGGGSPGGSSASASPYGRRIDVRMASIGQEVPEYLVSYDVLAAALRDHGSLEPVSAQEAAALRLVGGAATGTFEGVFRERVLAAPQDDKARLMTDAEKRYSFLNRWWVFRKTVA
jgi:SAM-dependent methyltransferase